MVPLLTSTPAGHSTTPARLVLLALSHKSGWVLGTVSRGLSSRNMYHFSYTRNASSSSVRT